jgi:hypothetical protein
MPRMDQHKIVLEPLRWFRSAMIPAAVDPTDHHASRGLALPDAGMRRRFRRRLHRGDRL